MGSLLWRQLQCNIWAGYLYRARQWAWLLGAIVLAVTPFTYLAILKSNVPPTQKGQCHFRARSISTTSSLRLLQTFVCNLDNACHDTGQDDLLDDYPGALINGLINDTSWQSASSVESLRVLQELPTSVRLLSNVAQLLQNPNLTELMEKGIRVRELVRTPDALQQVLTEVHGLDNATIMAIFNSKINMTKVLSLANYRDPTSVICNPSKLAEFLVTMPEDINLISKELCALNDHQAFNITSIFLKEIDGRSILEKVSEALTALGNYKGGKLLQQISSMLTSLGHLEALAPLAASFISISGVLQPITEAYTLLDESGWNKQNLDDVLDSLMGMFSSLPTSSPTTKALRISQASIDLMNIRNNTKLLMKQKSSSSISGTSENPWSKLIEVGSTLLNRTGSELMQLQEFLQEYPQVQVVTLAIVNLLPEILTPAINTTSLTNSLDKIVNQLPLEIKEQGDEILLEIYKTTSIATNITISTNLVLSLLSSEPQLPMHVSSALIKVLTNVTHLEWLLEEEMFADWLCLQSSWNDLPKIDWLTLNQKLCENGGKEKLEQINNLLKNCLKSNSLEFPGVNIKPSMVLDSVMKLYNSLQNHLVSMKMDDVERSKRDTNNTNNYVIDNYNLYEVRGTIRSFANLIDRINDSEETELFFGQRYKRNIADDSTLFEYSEKNNKSSGTELFEHHIAETKMILQQVKTIYVTIVEEILKKTNDSKLTMFTNALNETDIFEKVKDVSSLLLDILDEMIVIIENPEMLSSITDNVVLRKLIYHIFPANLVSDFEKSLDLDDIVVPTPIPHLVTVIHAFFNLANKSNGTQPLWLWMKNRAPYSANLIPHLGVLPRLLALPIAWFYQGYPDFDLQKSSPWDLYPCKNKSITEFFPNVGKINSLPSTWHDVKRIKENVITLEKYICLNFSKIMEEIESDQMLTKSITNMIENLSPSPLNLTVVHELMKSMKNVYSQMDAGEMLNEFKSSDNKTFIQEFLDAFNISGSSISGDQIKNRILTSFDLIVLYGLPNEIQKEVNIALAEEYFILSAATNVTRTVDEMFLWLASMKNLPTSTSLLVATSLMNTSLLQEVVQKNDLVNWTCSRETWSDLEENDWLLLEQNLCNKKGIKVLKDISLLLQPIYSKKNMNIFNNTEFNNLPTLLPSNVSLAIENLDKAIHELIVRISPEEQNRKKRYASKSIYDSIDNFLINEPTQKNDLEAKLNISMILLPKIKNLYLVLMKEVIQNTALTTHGSVYRKLSETDSIDDIINIMYSSFNAANEISELTEEYSSTDELLSSLRLRNIITSVLKQNFFPGIKAVVELMNITEIKLNSQVSQMILPLEVIVNFLEGVNASAPLSTWFEDEAPYTTNLLKQLSLLPRLLALPLLWSQHGIPNLEHVTSASWEYYPCGAATVTDLFPTNYVSSDLPNTWQNLDLIKRDIRFIEIYVCQNYSMISEELQLFWGNATSTINFKDEDENEDTKVNLIDAAKNIEFLMNFLLQMRPDHILEGINTSEGNTLLEELYDSLDTSGMKIGESTYMMMANNAFEQIEKSGNSTINSYVTYVHHAAYQIQRIMTTVDQILEDSPSLMTLLGIEEILPQISHIYLDGMNGTAKILLQETIDLISSTLMDPGWNWSSWVDGVCNNSDITSLSIHLLCSFKEQNYIRSPMLIEQSSSPLVGVIMDAMTSLQQPLSGNVNLSFAEISETWKSIQMKVYGVSATSLLQEISDNFIVIGRELFNEAELFMQELTELRSFWPWLVTDQIINKNVELSYVLNQIHVTLNWIENRIPNVFNDTILYVPQHLLEIHEALNMHWPDFLESLHYSLAVNEATINFTLTDICTENSFFLVEPPNNTGWLEDALPSLCSLNISGLKEEVMQYFRHDELFDALERSENKSFSSIKFINKMGFLSSKIKKWLNIENESSINSFLLPSYLQKEVWEDLHYRIDNSELNSTSSIIDTLEHILLWIGFEAEGEDFQKILKADKFFIANVKSILEPNLMAYLQKTEGISWLYSTVISKFPETLKEMIDMVYLRPRMIPKMVEEIYAYSNGSLKDSLCILNMTLIGESTEMLKEELCNIDIQEITNDIHTLLNLGTLEDLEELTLENHLNMSLEFYSKLESSIKSNELLEHISNPELFFGIEDWSKISYTLLNVTADDMWQNSTMILSTLLEPLVMLSRESSVDGVISKVLLETLEERLRWSRAFLAIGHGGDLWEAFKEANVDKPVVMEFLIVSENISEIILQYLNFFNYTNILQATELLQQNTLCDTLYFLLEMPRHHDSANNTQLMKITLDYLCNSTKAELLAWQLIPSSPPAIVGVPLGVDTATLALLLDHIGWEMYDIVDGSYFQDDIKLPQFLYDNKWMLIQDKIQELLERNSTEGLALCLSVGLDVMRQYAGEKEVNDMLGFSYHVLKRFSNCVHDESGKLNMPCFTSGLKFINDMISRILILLPDIFSIILWIPKSQFYRELLSDNMSPKQLVENMCKEGVHKYLFHPLLIEKKWSMLQNLLCDTNTDRLLDDLSGLYNTSEILDGNMVNWFTVLKVIQDVTNDIKRLNLQELTGVLVDNAFVNSAQNITNTERYIDGIFNNGYPIWQWLFDSISQEQQVEIFEVTNNFITVMNPISEHGNVWERIQDPDKLFLLLLQYSNIQQDLQYSMDIYYQNVTDGRSEEQILLSVLKETITNLTQVLIPPVGKEEAVPYILMNASLYILEDPVKLVVMMKSPICSQLNINHGVSEMFHAVAKVLELFDKHLTKWNFYEDLLCKISKNSLNDILNKVIYEFDWKNDFEYIVNGSISEFDCIYIISKMGLINNKVDAVITKYWSNTSHVHKMSECLYDAVNSTSGSQLKGLLNSLAVLLGSNLTSESLKPILENLANIPGATEALQALGARLAVFHPLEKMLNKDFKEEWNISYEVVQLIENGLMIDINRIYDVSSSTLVPILKDEEKMMKLFKIPSQVLSTVSPRVKRNLQISENKNELHMRIAMVDILNAVQSVGPENFAKSLLSNVNDTYLDSEIENIQVEAIVSSDWLSPMMIYLSDATNSIAHLDKLGAFMDLDKILAGEVNPVEFLSSSVQLLQVKTWKDLSHSLSSLIDEAVPLLVGSELNDDLQYIVDGIDGIQNAVTIGIMDPLLPTSSMVDDWSVMEEFLHKNLSLGMDVIEALKGSSFNIAKLINLEDTPLTEMVCNPSYLSQVVILHETSQVDALGLSNSLCTINDPTAVAHVFLEHLELAPLIHQLSKFGLNSTLSEHNMTLNGVTDALSVLSEATDLIPGLTYALKHLKAVTDIFKSPLKYSNDAEIEVRSPIYENVSATLHSLSTPEFLERAGKVLCGHPLNLVPDSLGVLEASKYSKDDKSKKNPLEENINEYDVCKSIENELMNMIGGNMILHYIMPLLKGKILYTPDNNITRQIIKEANQTFDIGGHMREALKALQKDSLDFTQNSDEKLDIQNLEEILSKTWVRELMDKLVTQNQNYSLLLETQQIRPYLEESVDVVEETGDVLRLTVNLMECLSLDRFVAIDSEEELLDVATRLSQNNEFLAGLVFKNIEDTLPKHIKYSIRVSSEKTPNTRTLGPKSWRPGPYRNMAVDSQYHKGFLQLQEMIDQAILRLQMKSFGSVKLFDSNSVEFSKSDRVKRSTSLLGLNEEKSSWLEDIQVLTKQQPYPCYEEDNFMIMLNESPVLSFLFSFVSFLLFIVFLIRDLVDDRCSRNKQMHEVMGLRIWLQEIVWFAYSFILLLALIILVCLIISFGGLLPRIDVGLLFAFLLCYGMSLISFCYLIGTTVGGGSVLPIFIGVMSIMAFNVPFISVSVITTPTPLTILVLLSLLPSSAFGLGFRVICQYELLEIGANYNNLWKPPVRDSEYSLGLSFSMLLVDSIIFFVISLIVRFFKSDWLQQVVLSKKLEVGSYSMKGSQATLKQNQDYTYNIFQDPNLPMDDVDPGVKQSLKKGLSIVGLRKIFQERTGAKVAVDNLNLDLYEGQILVMLGHNGAGKTSTISMLTGEVSPSAGYFQVYGYDNRNSWDKARRMMGFCPQGSVLPPFLTAREILFYYTTLKGTPKDVAESEVERTLGDVGLSAHRNHFGHQLSEGLRRRLCLAVAFSGDSKLIILDEPTSGVDPAARTAMWEVISRNRSGRTILLTTHHLDEAEILADRVAILHQGKLLCLGSPLALKSEYGCGYRVTLSNCSLDDGIIGKNQFTSMNSADLISPPLYDVLLDGQQNIALSNLIQEFVPNGRLQEAHNGEITFSLPLVDQHGNSNRLAELFGYIENRLDGLGYSSFEIRPTSLEDVIISLNNINNLENNSLGPSQLNLQDGEDEIILSNTRAVPLIFTEPINEKRSYSFKPLLPVRGLWLAFQRIHALLFKRFFHHSRDWIFYIQMFILPLAFVILAMIGSTYRPIYNAEKPIVLNADLYKAPMTTFIRNLEEEKGKALIRELVDSAVEDYPLQSETQWQRCPSDVASVNTGAPSCHIESSVNESQCSCFNGHCVIDVSPDSQKTLNNFLLATRRKHIQNRLGGITIGVKDPRNEEDSQHSITLWYDNSGHHVLPVLLNSISNARLHLLMNSTDYGITTTNHPLTFSGYDVSNISMEQHVADLGIGLLILVAQTVVVSSLIGFVVGERRRGERRVMRMAAVNHHAYWTAVIIWDTMIVLINIILMAVVLIAFNQKQFIENENLAAFILLSLLYGLSMLPIFYLFENFFIEETVAIFIFFCATFGVGLITTLMLVVAQIMHHIKALSDMESVIKYLFLVLPPFAFTSGIKDLALSHTKSSIMAQLDVQYYVSPFSWDVKLEGGLGIHYLTLSLWAALGIIFLHAWPYCKTMLPKPFSRNNKVLARAGAEEDKDVAAERVKIQCSGESKLSALRLSGLGKDYRNPPTVAVNSLYLDLNHGECFSLLGLNGAGKTTTFQCLTGELQPSRGQIFINGLPLNEALDSTSPLISYCPQTHAIDPNLTPTEMLTVMAMLRGFQKNEIKTVVNRAIRNLGLAGHADTYIRNLSGGSKRKVSLALALLGDPVLILLDEPTSGMDPSSRRLVWRAIESVTQDGRTVLLTSHSMDEVNQLSHRLAIMVNGHFVCMGSPHYLKYKLGEKYTIRIKTENLEDVSQVIDYLRKHLNEVLLKEHHHLMLVAEVSRSLSLQVIFQTLTEAKSLGVTEFDISQTTLNEVFRLLTSHQGDGQLPIAPTGDPESSLPMHLPNLHQAGPPNSRSTSSLFLQSVPAPLVHYPAPIDTELGSPKLHPLSASSLRSLTPSTNVVSPYASITPSYARTPTPQLISSTPPLGDLEDSWQDRSSVYDNVDFYGVPQTTLNPYGTIQEEQMDSPNSSENTESGSASDSPEEEWTHL